ncbi:MAG: YebC/PmpR family DNA-binding transcriptional regulator [Magnetococcales bacterium]|nr:YebC/PmpR family DNA-binding transcriptional regulator [Magnetococcales bacterium]MBF0151821.1 YebC/PmpR family DNA-binding transcriptional regulator [Magnetococcales bacterium]MBF0174588.1 YebC/PmpR family DNA-binding transcriptional regulator [Magnetococcales bacterium]MBF0346741.1 YebC/PmpR family DNA-binding transcriptional regulator [Magnetococcales bacterium]MBF0630376.1 YebC/PmpR family DNA-binding transcriptional regulator [Magnetococcales bacterium]
MSGHSKWANIKHRKGAQDAKRGKIFTKLIREITVSARMGGGDQNSNPRLRAALIAARGQNMSKDTMEKAIKRGTGDMDGADYQEVRFEGYGPGGVAMIVDTLTDNNNRTVADIRYIFNRYGGNLGTSGCVSYMFDRRGHIVFEQFNEDQLMEAALEAGALDVVVDGNTCEVITEPDDLETVRETLLAKNVGTPVESGMIMRPQNTVTLDEKNAASMLKMMDRLEDNDDVQRVSANFDIPEEVMELLAVE